MKKILLILCLSLLLVSCGEKKTKRDVYSSLHEIDTALATEFPFDVHSEAYLLIRLNDLKVLYRKNEKEKIYPASLTKVLTMDTVLHNVQDTGETSSLSSYQYWDLIARNASVAYLDTDHEYSVEDLLYALVLPSGADAAVALGNLFDRKGEDLVEKMNDLSSDLSLSSSHFTNPTGLHDDDLYTSVEDLLSITLDTLSFLPGRMVLESTSHTAEDGTLLRSTISPLLNEEAEILGGKTGFTGQAGQNLLLLFRYEERSYLLILTGAQGDPGYGEYYHYDDAREVLERLFYE